MTTIPKVCKLCESPLIQKGGERADKFAKRKFCSRSCAGTYQNDARHGPGRHKKKEEAAERALARKLKHKLVTKGELFATRINWQSARSSIAGWARDSLVEAGRVKHCSVCSYVNHVEVCHIKSVSSFKDSASISEINDLSNLVYLCPNHHWEFDHGLLDNLNGRWYSRHT